MRFMIHGADQKTGREMTVVMEAPDESEAERRALYNDILVSSVARFTAGAASPGGATGGSALEFGAKRHDERNERRADPTASLWYHPREFPPEERGPAPPHPVAAVPGYRDVLHGARWLDRVGLTARWGGGSAVVAGLALILIALADPVRQRLALPAEPVLFLTAAAVLTALGVLCLVCGVLISMTSGLVVAVRDIAQNTFHVAAQPTAESASLADDPRASRAALMRVTSCDKTLPVFVDAAGLVETSGRTFSLPRRAGAD